MRNSFFVLFLLFYGNTYAQITLSTFENLASWDKNYIANFTTKNNYQITAVRYN